MKIKVLQIFNMVSSYIWTSQPYQQPLTDRPHSKSTARNSYAHKAKSLLSGYHRKASWIMKGESSTLFYFIGQKQSHTSRQPEEINCEWSILSFVNPPIKYPLLRGAYHMMPLNNKCVVHNISGMKRPKKTFSSEFDDTVTDKKKTYLDHLEISCYISSKRTRNIAMTDRIGVFIELTPPKPKRRRYGQIKNMKSFQVSNK